MQVRTARLCSMRTVACLSPVPCHENLSPFPPMAPQQGINKLIRLLEGDPEEQFNAEQYMNLYTCVLRAALFCHPLFEGQPCLTPPFNTRCYMLAY